MNLNSSLHNEYFRNRIDGSVLGGDDRGSITSAFIKIRGPCEAGSRGSEGTPSVMKTGQDK
jgi:hypothetical protein|eukprot:scaffold3846_cov291-Chaetoceros_neogracile.AAC.2